MKGERNKVMVDLSSAMVVIMRENSLMHSSMVRDSIFLKMKIKCTRVISNEVRLRVMAVNCGAVDLSMLANLKMGKNTVRG